MNITTEATAVLRYLTTHRTLVPTDVGDVIPGANARYGRELLGMLVHAGYAWVVDTNDGDAWAITVGGTAHIAELDNQSRPVVDLSHTGQRAPNKENKMTETAAPAKTAKPIEFRKCGCGCSADVAGKAKFKQGHDARMISQLVAAVVGNNAGSNRKSQAAAVLPPAFTAAQVKNATGNADIQNRIDDTAKAVAEHFGEKLGTKAANAMQNGWNRESDRNNAAQNRAAIKAAKAAAPKGQVVTAKVGRWTKEGVIKGGKLHTKDAKGNAQVIEKGKFEVIETPAADETAETA